MAWVGHNSNSPQKTRIETEQKKKNIYATQLISKKQVEQQRKRAITIISGNLRSSRNETTHRSVCLALARQEGQQRHTEPSKYSRSRQHSLVELDILQLNGLLAPRRSPARLEQQLVVQPQLQLRHARQERLQTRDTIHQFPG